MISHRPRLEGIVKAKLKELQLRDFVGCDVCGPCYVMGPDPSGARQMVLQVGWVVLVTLKHNVLLGQDDIGVTVPLAGVLPQDRLFEMAAEFLLNEARKIRSEQSSITGTVSGKAVDRAQEPQQLELPLGLPSR